MNRDEMVSRVRDREPWDLVVIGGGATGAGVAVDAATRGYRTLLVEQHDFGKGTSSRSTKLIHGGVRYLARGEIGLVREALRERARLWRNAPHLVHDREFIIPCYRWWQAPWYGIGLKAYDLLAGGNRWGPSRHLSRDEALARLPNVKEAGLRGGIAYHDGQFDDARLLLHLVMTAADHGATVLNYAPVVGLLRRGGNVAGVRLRDAESGHEYDIAARVVVNATGVFCDAVRRFADPAAAPLVTPSQGIHLVVDRSFLPGERALLVPDVGDGRVMFLIPWHGYTLLGTTDTAVRDTPLEPTPTPEEIDAVLATAARYLARPPTRSDICSAFAGLRPLVRASSRSTARLSRDHTIHVDAPGLVTITGGKWTTYRNMAEDCVNEAARLAGLPSRPCATASLHLHGYAERSEFAGSLSVYGADAANIRELAQREAHLAEPIAQEIRYLGAEVAFAAREEMARTVEDVLARRTRALFLDACVAIAMAPRVAAILANVLGRDERWQAEEVRRFTQLAEGYLPRRSHE
jgi:glycerol-3-phosphate dehydrogenase